jgi:hypothetical protein
MAERTDKRYDRAHQRVFMRSFKRLKRLGAADDDAGQIAREVVDRATLRAKAPVFRTDEEFAELTTAICAKLSNGMSYYELFVDMPFLATGRVDRIVAVATRTKPPVEAALAAAAKRATLLEKFSGAVAILLFSLALGTIGLWYAIAVGVVVCVATEIYVQALMPASLRKTVATFRIPAVVFAVATVALILLAYRWYDGITEHPYLLAVVAAVAVVTIAFLVPGLVLARLLSRREGRWRRDLEQTLLEERGRAGDRREG